jgi:purine nucleosidase
MLKKILLDTDIGSDIDDAICLAYLLAQPECELLGITTVSGEPVKRAMIADALCKAAQKKVPIFPGAENPLLIAQKQPVALQARALERWEHDTTFAQGEAVEFLRATIRKHPGEITLLSIGPLTNIALLFSVDPEIPGLLKELVLMCGVFTNRMAGVGPIEWNARCDPHATAIVYGSGVKLHRSVGLDVTFKVTMSIDEMKNSFKADILKPVMDFSKVWAETADRLVFHDPLAGVTIFDPDVCKFEKGNAEVELESKTLAGVTYWEPDETCGRHEVALEVDSERFLNHFFSVVNAYRPGTAGTKS